MEKLKELWGNWRGSIGFIGGALVVSTTFFTCTVDPNEEAIKDAVLPKVEESKDAEQSEESKEAAEAEPIPVEKVEEVEGAKEAKK